jgi:hypothetical protein
VSLSVVLKSRAVRRSFTGGSTARVIGNSISTEPGWGGKIWNALKPHINWAIGKLWTKIRSINLLDAWGWFERRFHDLWNFDWNQTDAELDERNKQAWEQVKVAAAGLTGRAAGYLVCGALPAVSITVFNEALGVYLLKKFGEEAVSELAYSLAELIRIVAATMAIQLLRFIYKSGRRLIKAAARNKAIRGALEKAGVNTKAIDEWGEESSKEKEASFAAGLRNRIEKLPDSWEEAAEEFVDEFSDACFEAGYIIAGGIDEFFSLQAHTKEVFNPLGHDRIVRFTPNKDVKSEEFVLAGKEELIKAEMISIINQSQVIDNREVTLSLPTEEWGRIPVISSGAIEIELEFFKFKQPPYWTNERRGKNGRQRVHLYNVNRAKVDFESLQNDFRRTGFLNGNVRASIRWTDGRVTTVYVSSEKEGKEVAKLLEKYTHEDIVYPISFSTREINKLNQSSIEVVRIHRQYLANIKIWNWDRITKFEKAQGKLGPSDRKRLIRRFRVDYDNKPSEWDSAVNEALKGTL